MENKNVCQVKSNRSSALFWATLAFFGGFAGVSAFGPIVAKLKLSMDLGPLRMGLLAASPALTGSLLRIPFGAVVDRMGGKKPILILLILAAAGVTGIMMIFRHSPQPGPAQYPYFLLTGVLCGAGIAVFSVGISSVSYWYPQKDQGTALAVYAGLGNLAPGLFAMILPSLVITLGFSRSYILWSGLLILLVLFFGIYMKDAPYFQYKDQGISVDSEFLHTVCNEELVPSGNAVASLAKAGADWRTWILTYFYFVTFGGFIALTIWFPTYWAESFKMTMVRAGMLTALFSLLASALRVPGGYIADRMGGERVTFVSFLIVAIGSLLLIYSGNLPEVAIAGEVILALGMGFSNAAVFKLVPKYSPEAVGGAAGIVGGLGAFGGFVIPPLMGLFVKLYGAAGYSKGFVVFLSLSVFSFVLFMILFRGKK